MHGRSYTGPDVGTVARQLDIELVDTASEFDLKCDVFAPCAMGGILHDLTISRLRCRIVAGGAHNVLARALHGDRLHELGILYAPDFVINSGALIRGVLFHLERRAEPIAEIGARLGRTLNWIFERARADGAPRRAWRSRWRRTGSHAGARTERGAQCRQLARDLTRTRPRIAA